MRIGMPELVMILSVGLLRLLPFAVLVWIAFMVVQIRRSQQQLEARLDSLQQALRRS